MSDNTENTVVVRFYADWQMLTFDDHLVPAEHMHRLFSEEMQDMVQDFHVIRTAGRGGFFYVFFTGTILLDTEEVPDRPKPKKRIKLVLDDIVGDTDVKVRWFQREI